VLLNLTAKDRDNDESWPERFSG